MFLTIGILVSFTGLVAGSEASRVGVPRECSTWDVAMIEKLAKRVDILENRDLVYRQQMSAMQKKLKRQDREILALRMMLGPRSTEPVHDQDENDTREGENPETHIAYVHRRSEKVRGQKVRRQEVDVTNVAFLAVMSNGDVHHLGVNQNVEFNQVVTNEGNAYNPHAGVFVAPVAGTYVFSATVSAAGRNVTHFVFALNGNMVTLFYVNGLEKYYDSSAQTIVLQLQKGDDVAVIHSGTVDHSIAGHKDSLFSGFLLRKSSGSEIQTIVG